MHSENVESRVRALPRWRKVLYALLPVIVLLALFEVSARVWESMDPPLPADLGLGFDPDSRLFVERADAPGMMALAPAKEQFFQAQSFAREKPAGVYRIAVLGESSVNYLKGELDLLRERLSQQFPNRTVVEIINAGGCSYGSERLLGIARELMEYDLDLLVVYIGNNEFEELTHRQLVDLKRLPLQRVLGYTAVGRRARHLMAMRSYKVSREAGGRIDYLRTLPMNAPGFQLLPREVSDERMRNFASNYDAILQAAQEHGVQVICGTVPSNFWMPMWYSLEDERRYQAEVLPLRERGDYAGYYRETLARISRMPRLQASDAENAVTREAAARHGVALVDFRAVIEKAEPHGVPGEIYFSDVCHLTSDGRKLWIAAFEPIIGARIAASSP